MRWLSTWVTFTASTLAACGSSGSLCEDATDVLCQRMCECDFSAGCRYGDESSSISFESEGDCRGFFRRRCASERAAEVDWARCESVIASQVCDESFEEGALPVVEACELPD